MHQDSFERGIRLFNEHQFFDSHEAWEEVWTREQGPRRLFLQSLIHLAVGLYHARSDNCVGAIRQLRKGLRKLAGYLPVCESIDTARLYRDALAVLEQIEAGATEFEPPHIRVV
jgi:uncharacterized protein